MKKISKWKNDERRVDVADTTETRQKHDWLSQLSKDFNVYRLTI